MLSPFDPSKPVIIFELKSAEKFFMMERLCEDALQQIEDRNYATEYYDEGYQKVIKYGVCFCKKSCKILGKLEIE